MVQSVESGQREEDTSACMIDLTNGGFALIDAIDYDLVCSHTYYCIDCRGVAYAARGHDRIMMHHDITGTKAKYDHINGDGLDNRRSNLRLCTHSQNMQNLPRRSDNTSGYKGVVRKGSGWRARIQSAGKVYDGGTHNTPEEAARAYDELAKKHHGEFAWLNFPDDTA